MEHNPKNPFITSFCNKLSMELELRYQQQVQPTPGQFLEMVSTVAHEILESYSADEAFQLYEQPFSVAEAYKQLAINSIESYNTTNLSLGKITGEHSNLIESTRSQTSIDYSLIAKKFDDVQKLFKNEVNKADAIISGLRFQIRELEEKTTLDPLTQAYNRFALHDYFRVILSQEKLDFDIFALMVDIDDFKQINDRFGHIAGDKVLIFITKLLKKALRDSDRVYRYGGEEFIILINRTDMQGAIQASERLLTLCRNNQPLFQNEQIPVTLSIGMTQIQSGDTINSIIERADTALYRAKNSGKDKMEIEA